MNTWVKYTGEKHLGLYPGMTALMDDKGLVQLDGKQDWRNGDHRNPWCYGWHDLGTEWVLIETKEPE